jgi:Putative auto-transporter adhesin, head GIN domain
MKRTILFLSLVLVAVGGCKLDSLRSTSGSGTMRLEKRDVPAFTAVDISGAYEVEIVAQKEQSLEIEGDDNLLPLIKTEVKNGVLVINNDKSFSTDHKLRVRISVSSLDGVETSGASDITASNVKSEDFKIEASGAGNLEISGETKTLDVDISGAGRIDAKDLRAQKVTVNSSGAADADVYASEELSIDVSGAGNVNYYGNPKIVNEDRAGAGTISKK